MLLLLSAISSVQLIQPSAEVPNQESDQSPAVYQDAKLFVFGILHMIVAVIFDQDALLRRPKTVYS